MRAHSAATSTARWRESSSLSRSAGRGSGRRAACARSRRHRPRAQARTRRAQQRDRSTRIAPSVADRRHPPSGSRGTTPSCCQQFHPLVLPMIRSCCSGPFPIFCLRRPRSDSERAATTRAAAPHVAELRRRPRCGRALVPSRLRRLSSARPTRRPRVEDVQDDMGATMRR